MSVYVCLSSACELRDKCELKFAATGGKVHVIYFTPPEQYSGNCPHFMSRPTDGKSALRENV